MRAAPGRCLPAAGQPCPGWRRCPERTRPGYGYGPSCRVLVEDQGVFFLPLPSLAFPASFLSNLRAGALPIPSWCLQLSWDLPSHPDKPISVSTCPRGNSKHLHITPISRTFSSAEIQLKKTPVPCPQQEQFSVPGERPHLAGLLRLAELPGGGLPHAKRGTEIPQYPFHSS